MIGRWIDSLSDEERDRIVSAMGWGYGSYPPPSADEKYNVTAGLLCLMDNAAGIAGAWMCESVRGGCDSRPEARRFDALCRRFGLARVVRCVKLRAGSSLSLPLPESAREAVAR